MNWFKARWHDLIYAHSLFWQMVRFGFVGVLNTGVYYGLYLLFLLAVPYIVAHIIAWVLSVVFSFFMNCFFTYHVLPTWDRFIKFPLSTLVNFLMTTGGTVLMVQWMGIDERWAPLIAGILAIPFTFAVTKLVLVGRGTTASPHEDLAGHGQR